MINKSDIDLLMNELEKANTEKDKINALSQEVVSISKKAILAVNKKEDPSKYITEMETMLHELKNYNLKNHTIALQEYIEALAYYMFLKYNKLVEYSKLKEQFNVEYETYFKGISDFVGELVRNALNSAIENNYERAHKIYIFVNDLYNEFSVFNFRSGDLRKQFDSMRWNLKKLQDVVFELKVKGKLN